MSWPRCCSRSFAVRRSRPSTRISPTSSSRSFAVSTKSPASAPRHAAVEHVRIVEVGPRDGLQNEKTSIPLQTKIELIERLAGTGLRDIEAGSFVSPKWVPQMANSADVLKYLLHTPPPNESRIGYNFLVPNIKGLQNMFAILDENQSQRQQQQQQHQHHQHQQQSPPELPELPESLLPEISIFAAATESFSRANLNCSIAESLERFRPIVSSAVTRKMRVRGYVSVALGCPIEGPKVPPGKVAEVTASLLEMGADQVSVADTTGMGTAPRTRELLHALAAAGVRTDDIALHLHDTYGQALINALVGLEHGVHTFDASVAGLGGCPFAKGATGNVATEDLAYCLHSLGVHTGVDVQAVAEIGEWISEKLGRENGARAGKAILARLRG